IGAYAALTPLVLGAVPALLAPIYGTPAPVFPALRFLLVFLILLPASAGMGATLPIVTDALARRDGGASDAVAARLYGLNTLGASAGTLVGGFVLLPRLGLLRSTIAGGAFSLTAGGLAWLVTRGKGAPDTVAAGSEGTGTSAAPAPAAGAAADGGSFAILP